MDTSARDPVLELLHDHEDLNQLVRDVGELARRDDGVDPRALEAQLGELREQMFLHFAREEEGLFPSIAQALPDTADDVAALLVAHDAVCGALARMLHAARSGSPVQVRVIFERFESAYTAHARAERAFLQSLAGRLSPEDARDLSALVRTL